MTAGVLRPLGDSVMAVIRSCVIAVLLLVPLVAHGQRPAALSATTDAAMLAGRWRAVSLTVDGQTAKPEDAAKITVINTADGGWAVVVDGKQIAKGTNELHAATDPKRIDFEITESTDSSAVRRRHEGIYDLGETTRRLCFAPSGKPRPTSFSAPKGSGAIFVTFERVPD